MMAAITMGSDGDSLRLGREVWTRFISTWAVFESGSICLMARGILSVPTGTDELKSEPRDGRTKGRRTKGRTYEGLLPCFRNRYRFHTALVKLKMVCSLFRTLFFIWHT